MPPGVLYQVKASYKYQAEDVDELNFDVGEVIDVVEYDDPEEQVVYLNNSRYLNVNKILISAVNFYFL